MKSERTYPVYKVNKHAEGLLVGGHPWVYENDILEAPGTAPENGTLVDVVSPKGAYLGTGFLSLKSKIRVRLISRNANDTFDTAFWRRRVEYAWAYRKTVLEPADLSACRFIFGEADQFPGLTVDRFNNVLVTQTLSVGMEKLKPVLFPLLAEVLRADGQTIDGIYERNDEALRAKEGLEQNKGWFTLPGESHPETTQTEICENGVYYHVDFENGQKTGFFLDQKYNRRAVARLAAGHTVLDCFTHTGSFALNAAKGGAARVTAADISAEAIAMAKRNADRNGLDNMDFLCEDTFALLPRLEKEGHPYDFIILDPPAFTKARRTVENAMRGYKEINYRAMKLLPRGGYLATCSCSHFATAEKFEAMLRSAAHDAGVQLLELDQPRAHHHLPIAAGHTDTYAPAQFLPQAGDGLACSQHFVVDVAAMLVQAQPHLGGLYAPGGALDQLHAHLLFQLGQVVAHVGARHLELACRLAEVAAVNDFHQQGQRLQVHLGFSLVIVQSYLTLCQFMQRL